MVCITGDVHHVSLCSNDLPYLNATEVVSAIVMAKIAAEFNLPVTLFCTGKCVIEERISMKHLADMPNVEIGGHNYFAFKPRRPFTYWHRLTGLKNGPYFFQSWEIGKTKKVLEEVTLEPVVSWRDHGYRHDRNTRRILRRYGFRYFSDVLSKDGGQPEWNEGIIDVPLNTLPDHDYVYHAGRQPDTIDAAALLNTHFATKPISKEDWLLRVKSEIRDIDSRGGIATVLAHPACMETFDEFRTFRELCRYAQQFESRKMRDLAITAPES